MGKREERGKDRRAVLFWATQGVHGWTQAV